MAYRIKRSQSVQQALRAVVLEQIEEGLTRLDSTDRDVADIIHDIRKRCKKIRAALRLVRPSMKETARLENIHFRETARRVSGLRDLDVLPATLDTLGNGRRSERSLLHEPLRTLLASRAEGIDPRERLRAVRQDLIAARDRVASWTLEDEGFAALKRGLQRIYRRGRRAMTAALGDPTPENLHQWRKRVKDFGYQLRLLRGAGRPMTATLRGAAEKLAERLGAIHDLDVLQGTLRDNAERFDPQALDAAVSRIEERRAEQLQRCARLGGRVYAERPKALRRRMAAYWHAWRTKDRIPTEPS